MVHVLIGPRDQRPNRLQSPLQLVLFKQRAGLGGGVFGVRRQFVGQWRHQAVAITLEHRERAVYKVAQTIGQLSRITRTKAGIGPVPVGADVQFAQHVKAEGVHTPLVNDGDGVNDVAGALAQLLPILLPPTMNENLFGQGQPHGLKHHRPIDGVKLQDVLADDVDICRPQRELIVCSCWLMVESAQDSGIRKCGGDADVVDQGVEPYVGDEIGIEWQGDAPVQARNWAADAQIFEHIVPQKPEDPIAVVVG